MTVGKTLVMAFIVIAFWLGNYSGYHKGYVAGRIAVRKHYEQVSR